MLTRVTDQTHYETIDVTFAPASLSELGKGSDELILPLETGNQPPEIVALIGRLPVHTYLDSTTPGRIEAGEKTRPADAYIKGTFHSLHNVKEETDVRDNSIAASSSIMFSDERRKKIVAIEPALGNVLPIGDLSDADEVHFHALRGLVSPGRVHKMTDGLADNPHIAKPLVGALFNAGLITSEVRDRRRQPIGENPPDRLALSGESREGLVFSTISLLAFRLCLSQLQHGRASVRVLANQEVMKMSENEETIEKLGEAVSETMANLSPVRAANITFIDIRDAHTLIKPRYQDIKSQYDWLIKTRGKGMPMPVTNKHTPLGKGPRS